MLGKFYGDVFDVELYCQMVDLIYRLSEHSGKEQLYRQMENSTLFLGKPNQEMEDAYGLRYPGEVLGTMSRKSTS